MKFFLIAGFLVFASALMPENCKLSAESELPTLAEYLHQTESMLRALESDPNEATDSEKKTALADVRQSDYKLPDKRLSLLWLEGNQATLLLKWFEAESDARTLRITIVSLFECGVVERRGNEPRFDLEYQLYTSPEKEQRIEELKFVNQHKKEISKVIWASLNKNPSASPLVKDLVKQYKIGADTQ